MKRCMMALLAIVLCACCALAEADSRAATAVQTKLYDAPHESAGVLMEYYQGVRVEVIREADPQYVQVNVGQEGGSLTGYMKKAHLTFGEENIRANRPIQVCYEQRGWTMYSYCDALAPVISENNDVFVYAMGENEDWIHAVQANGSEDITGFVKKRADAIPDMKRTVDYAYAIRTVPLEGELTFEEAVQYAKERILADGIEANAADGELVTEQMLESCTVHVQADYSYDEPNPLCYTVTFIYQDRTWEDGFPMICAFACLYVEGEEIVAYDYGKG